MMKPSKCECEMSAGADAVTAELANIAHVIRVKWIRAGLLGSNDKYIFCRKEFEISMTSSSFVTVKNEEIR